MAARTARFALQSTLALNGRLSILSKRFAGVTIVKLISDSPDAVAALLSHYNSVAFAVDHPDEAATCEQTAACSEPVPGCAA